MDTHVVGKWWFCLECKDDEGNRAFQSVGSLRAHACSVHKVQLSKLSYREDPHDNYKIKTGEEYIARTKGKIVRGGDHRTGGEVIQVDF